ncbi:flagellar biosynthesis anti-sigma factor FlgM [Clostridium sp. SM-530-WT-3G]|uniref:flagellar biosynthesis anti-sigma factor FlgM n=1 Tax=Clostridium sp. SM-530-WT-3G TaxID=2725303 RepID=UPI00145C9010|nr:flagellar biosynthesis anti-sigma factor FlgM [Clostridium sp. SM-530-WT-3G]NME82803.1 flagellar biosynthesis anti-sigma factor FlgM [Clostridium sp. SM-530-WT-3G]
MSIDRINRQSFITTYNTNSKRNIEKVNKINNTDTIEISDLGKSLKDYSMINDINNAKKVAEIKRKVEAGTYNVDARLTARSILNYMKGSNV